MDSMEKIMLLTGVVWTLFTVYAILLLLPFMARQLRVWEMKLKGSKARLPFPNLPQRMIFLLLAVLMTAVAWSAALQRDLRETIGISPGMATSLMILLPVLYFALGWLKKSRR
jgi:hypothetical protein